MKYGRKITIYVPRIDIVLEVVGLLSTFTIRVERSNHKTMQAVDKYLRRIFYCNGSVRGEAAVQ